MSIFSDFIPQNIAPVNTRRIAIFDKNGNRIGQIPLERLTPPNNSKKLYSFLLLSDVHMVYETGLEDTRRALQYANNNTDIKFVCIAGDLGKDGTEAEFQLFEEMVNTYYSKNKVYVSAGNHEYYKTTSHNYFEKYTEKPLYYTFKYNNDLFVMVGVVSGTEGELFTEGELQWLYETLEANRDKRVFLLEHILTSEGCGDALLLYPYAKLANKTESIVFKSLLKHYTNAIFIHGHSHMRFELQKYNYLANYDKNFGCHSVHVPSISIPRDVNDELNNFVVYTEGSEGYIVDVYENGIHLRGRDFAKGKFLPIASYWLDTTIQPIQANAYVDDTGTIITDNV